MSAWWSWALTAVGITGLYFAGQRRALGWAIGLGAQALWIAYAIATRQWGFIASALAYSVVYARNFLSWQSGSARTRERAKAKEDRRRQRAEALERDLARRANW